MLGISVQAAPLGELWTRPLIPEPEQPLLPITFSKHRLGGRELSP